MERAEDQVPYTEHSSTDSLMESQRTSEAEVKRRLRGDSSEAARTLETLPDAILWDICPFPLATEAWKFVFRRRQN
jgi:hypothetical protein